jgi:hypothetical protein
MPPKGMDRRLVTNVLSNLLCRPKLRVDSGLDFAPSFPSPGYCMVLAPRVLRNHNENFSPDPHI